MSIHVSSRSEANDEKNILKYFTPALLLPMLVSVEVKFVVVIAGLAIPVLWVSAANFPADPAPAV